MCEYFNNLMPNVSALPLARSERRWRADLPSDTKREERREEERNDENKEEEQRTQKIKKRKL